MVPMAGYLYLYLFTVPYGYVAGYYQRYITSNTNTITAIATTCITP